MVDKVEAPWSPAQVRALNAWQADRRVHPFTCTGERRDLAHVQYARNGGLHDLGILIAATDGWRCPVCHYRQTWAHPFMFDPRPPMAEEPPLVPNPVKLSVRAKAPPKPRTGLRGFAAMDPEKRRLIAASGGAAVPAHKRSFYKREGLASSAGKKGGQASRGGGRVKPL
jgi:general stress protein YciG